MKYNTSVQALTSFSIHCETVTKLRPHIVRDVSVRAVYVFIIRKSVTSLLRELDAFSQSLQFFEKISTEIQVFLRPRTILDSNSRECCDFQLVEKFATR